MSTYMPSVSKSLTTGSPGDDGRFDPPQVWKHVIIVVLSLIGVLVLVRVVVMRRNQLARREVLASNRDESTQACPAYTPSTPPAPAPPPRRLLSSLIRLCACGASRSMDEEAIAAMSPDERRRMRQRNDDIRHALQDAGLLVGPPRSRTRDAVEVEIQRRLRRERRDRRERRHERRRAHEEGVGLPVYTREKGEGEKVLIERGPDDDSSDDDGDDSDGGQPVQRLSYHAPPTPSGHPSPSTNTSTP